MRLYVIITLSVLTALTAPGHETDARAIGRPPDSTGKPSAAALLTGTWIGSLGSILRTNASIQATLRNHSVLNNAQRTYAPPFAVGAAHPVTIGVFGADGLIGEPAADLRGTPDAPPLWRDPRWTSDCAVPCRVATSDIAQAHVLLHAGSGSPPPPMGPGARLERWQRKVHIAWAPESPTGGPNASRRLGPVHTLVSYSRYAEVRYDTLPFDEVSSFPPHPPFLGPFGSVLCSASPVERSLSTAHAIEPGEGIAVLVADLAHAEATQRRRLFGDRGSLPKDSLADSANGPGNAANTGPLVAAWVDGCGPDGSGEHYAARYARELARHVRMASLGPCAVSSDVRRVTSASEAAAAFAQYVLVFIGDARIADDFVNAHVLRALAAGAVPVYLGAPNVAEALPPLYATRMLVEARHYPRPADLARRMELLATSPADYALLVEWRRHVSVGDFPRHGSPRALGPASLACRVCEYYAAHAGRMDGAAEPEDAEGVMDDVEVLTVTVRRPPARTLYRTVTVSLAAPPTAHSVTTATVTTVATAYVTSVTTAYATCAATAHAAAITAASAVPCTTANGAGTAIGTVTANGAGTASETGTAIGTVAANTTVTANATGTANATKLCDPSATRSDRTAAMTPEAGGPATTEMPVKPTAKERSAAAVAAFRAQRGSWRRRGHR